MSSYTTPAELEESYNTLFKTYATGRTKSLAWRKWSLKQLWWLIDENEDRIVQALKEDLNRHAFETFSMEVRGCKADILENLENFEKWAQGDAPNAGFVMGRLGKARLRKEPLGVVFIMAAWNFPLYLLISPLANAIAAGNCILLKPSELAPATQSLVVELFPKYLDLSAIRLVTGGPHETSLMLEKKFNHILFTGSNKVGRIIAEAAAKHLTPVVLELGGQCPAIVCKSADIDLAAKRIAYAKILNAGQICLSCNHVLVDPIVHDRFIQRLAFWNDRFLAEGSEGMSRIVNEKQFDRVMGLLKSTRGEIVYGGESNRTSCRIMPTVVKDVKIGDSLLSEEIFGPIAPVIISDVDTAIATVNAMPHPLGLYIFSSDQTEIEHILDSTTSGGVTINDIMVHAGVPGTPFGGVGDSGYGSYHGKYGFDTFSHTRTVVALPTWMDRVMSFRYAPYDIKNKKYIDIKNKLGFKPGETMEDQKFGETNFASVATKAMLAITALALLDSATGGRLLFSLSLKDVMSKLW